MEKNYFIGLDIGTDSCGWAVTDEAYQILKAKGQKLWGVRLFKEATSASERRVKRANRRRLDRRKLKLEWLREIFKPEIDKIDPNMLTRLKYSSLWEEDKILMNTDLKSKDSLFCTTVDGKTFTDKGYYSTYPTIYHLRKELTQKPAKDIRFLYLAIHNIIKRRGHFLYEGTFSENESLYEIIKDLIKSFSLLDEDSIFPITISNVEPTIENDILEELLKKNGIKQTKENFKKIFNATNKADSAIVESLVNGKINLKNIFKVDTDKKLDIDFNDENYEQKLEEIKTELDDEQYNFVNKLNIVFSNIQLKKILGNNNYICESMVDSYEEHHKQLRLFKDFIKKYHQSQYFKIFRDAQDKNKANGKKENLFVNYVLYSGGDIYNGKKRVINLASIERNKEDFYKFVKEILNLPVEIEGYDEEYYLSKKNDILTQIDSNNFLNKQRTKDNAVFPNKLYVKELKKILEVNATKFEFLNNTDENGLTNIDKIISILTFRVPYFVGPIGKSENAENDYSWTERDCSIEYKPWNFDKMINLNQAEDSFIIKMTNKCSYLQDEDVLPKQSILYSKFRVLNEINKLKFNGNAISVELKQKIFTQLFEKNAKISVKQLKNFLRSEQYYSDEDIKELSISGIDKDFVNNYSSYSKLCMSPNFGKEFVDNNIEVFEKIIKYHTIISDKNRLKVRVEREFPNLFTPAQLKEIKGLNYQGWGRLSKKFLSELFFINKITGERTTIIDELWNTNKNLQEIVFDSNYTLGEELLKYTKNRKDSITYNDIQELYCSPSVKRGVWQCVKIVDEIIQIMGKTPSKVFIEVTRHDEEKGEKGRKLSRKSNLESIYSSKEFKNEIKKTAYEIEELMNELSKEEDSKLRSEKLYLYFLQLGRCAYSGEKIDIKDIFDDHLYDVDHIIPQSKIKDDSINNKVLVKHTYNQMKGDIYPIYSIHPEWVERQKKFWELLNKLKLMGSEKLSRLTRTDSLSKEELGGFIARQLVETNQSVKAVIDLLRKMLPAESRVIFSKAKFVSDFRNKYDIPKSREVNDLHHCKDAYLNIVVGNVLDARFTEDPRNFFKCKNNNERITMNTKNLFDKTVYSSKPGSNTIVWDGEKDIVRIKDVCNKNDCLVSKFTFADYNGAFYDETIYKSLKNDPNSRSAISLKGDCNNPLSNQEKYGGYSKLQNAYFMVVESEKKGKKIKTIESVPILALRKYRGSKDVDEKILEYVAKENGLVNPKIIVGKMNFHSLLKINKGLYWLGGKTNNSYILHNANQWRAGNETTTYVKILEKFAEMELNAKKNKISLNLVEKDGKVIISKASKEGNREIAISKDLNIQLYDEIISLLGKPTYVGMQLEYVLRQKLEEKREKFVSLSVLEQARLLNGIIPRISTGARMANLQLLGEGASIGMLTIGKDITDKDITLIEQSPTGLHYKEVRL